MVKWCSLFLLIALPCFVYGQVGVNAKYLFGKSDILSDGFWNQDGPHVSVEYNFRLKEKRLEFRPGVGYRATGKGNTRDGHISGIDLDLGTAIYPFDFGGDCDCPTFSKDGNLVKKGFFLEAIPGASYQTLTRTALESGDPSRLPIRSKNMVFKLGGAVGLDIGVSDMLTITPLFTMTWLSASEWEGLNEDGSEGKLDDQRYFGPGLRVTYNSDDKNRRRRN